VPAAPAARQEARLSPAVILPRTPEAVRCPRCGKLFAPTQQRLQTCPVCKLEGPMVPADAGLIPDTVVGKPRRAALVFLLTWLPILHFGFWPTFLWQTFRPLDRQHGREHPTVAWAHSTLPLLGVFLALPYAFMGLRRLKRSRKARGLRKGIGGLTFTLVAILTPLAAMAYAGWLVGIHPDRDGAFDFEPDHFDAARLTDGEVWGATFWSEADWLESTLVLVLWGLSPAIALALAAASANKLWRAIYDERGEAWPWRKGAEETEVPVSP
jgi:hypothetical protein